MSAIYDIKKILFNNLKMKTQKSEKINIAKKKKKKKGNGFTFPDTTGPLEMYRLVYDSIVYRV